MFLLKLSNKICLFICLFIPSINVQQLVVLFVTAAMAQYYNSEQYPTVPSNGPYYYQGAQYQPIVPYQPASADGQWQTLRDARHQYPSGEYSYEYETQNGIIANEQSYIAGPNQAQRKTGFFQYPSPDGRILRVDYTADENGFQVSTRIGIKVAYKLHIAISN